MISCSDAIGTIQFENDGSASSKNPVEAVGKKLNVFDVQSILRGGGVFIPSHVLVSVFAKESAKAKEEDPFHGLTIEELDRAVTSNAVWEEDISRTAWKNVVMDAPSVLNFLGGALLLIAIGGVWSNPIPSVVVIGKLNDNGSCNFLLLS